MILIAIIFIKGIIFGMAAVAVRNAFAATKGFDIGLAGLVLISAETFVYFANANGVFAGFIVATFATIPVSVVWYKLAFEKFDTEFLSTGFLVGGLGLSGFAIGVTGLLYGPGLKFLEQSGKLILLGIPIVYLMASICALLGIILLLMLSSSRLWLEIQLLDSNSTFANELGCYTSDKALFLGFVQGGLCLLVGIGLSAVTGSTPSLGVQVFLVAAAAALLFRSFRIWKVLVAGLLLSSLEGAASYLSAPSYGLLPAFIVIGSVLLFRGVDRSKMALR